MNDREKVLEELRGVIRSGVDASTALAETIFARYELDIQRKERVANRLENKLKVVIEEKDELSQYCTKLQSEILDRDMVVTDDTSRMEAFKRRLEERDERVAALEARLDVSERERRSLSEAITRARASASEAENKMRSMNAQLLELEADRTSIEAQLSDATATGFRATRSKTEVEEELSQLRQDNHSLRSQLVTLKADAAELKTQQGSTIAELRSTLDVHIQNEERIRRELRATEARADELSRNVIELERNLSSVRLQEERRRELLESECKELRDISRLRKEALEDAETRLKEVADVTFALAKDTQQEVTQQDPTSERALRKRRLGGYEEEAKVVVPPEEILLVIQRELEQKAEELQIQAEEYTRAVNVEASLRVEVEQARREREAAVMEAEGSRAAAEKAERRAIDLRRRNADLERRLLLVTTEPPPGTTIAEHTPPAQRSTSRTPATTPKTPSSIDIGSAQKRQEELVTAIVAQRDLYRSMLLNSPFSPTKRP